MLASFVGNSSYCFTRRVATRLIRFDLVTSNHVTTRKSRAMLNRMLSSVPHGELSDSAVNASSPHAPISASELVGRIKLDGFTKWTQKKEIAKLLDSLSLDYKKVSTVPGVGVAFVTFGRADQLQAALPKLHDCMFKKCRIKASVAESKIDRNRRRMARNDGDAQASVPKEIADVVTPLWRLTYEEQLQLKERKLLHKCVQKILRQTRVAYGRKQGDNQQPAWLDAPSAVALPMNPILASPVQDGYRNKCEFTVGYTREGEKSVGFRSGSFVEGSVSVASAEECKNVSERMKAVVRCFNTFVAASPFLPYDINHHSGCWRQLTVRVGERTDEMMVVVQAKTCDIPDAAWEAEKARLKEALWGDSSSSSSSSGGDRGFKLTSLMVQPFDGVSNKASEDHPVELLCGRNYITETMMGLAFRISPGAFFQVNTTAAEQLYELVRKESCAPLRTSSSSSGSSPHSDGGWVEGASSPTDPAAGPLPLMLDVCCGTGTIGICLSSRASQVVGVELCESATRDAAVNARINGVRNCLWVNSKAEEVMHKLLSGGGSNPPKTSSAAAAAAGFIEDATVSASAASASDDTAATTTAAAAAAAAAAAHALTPEEIRAAWTEVATADALPPHLLGVGAGGGGGGAGGGAGGGGEHVVAVVDPPRAGLHPDCIRALRGCHLIKRLVYVSCNPLKSLVTDAVSLIGPNKKRMRGPAFRIVSATPVDLFPHTEHCEMVMVFERD